MVYPLKHPFLNSLLLTGQPNVTSLEHVTNGTSFTLNCTSTGSPASTVMWTKDGTLLQISHSYQTTQIMADGDSATYYNLLTVFSEPEYLLGTYGCSVLNTVGVSNVETVSIEGIPISEWGLSMYKYLYLTGNHCFYAVASTCLFRSSDYWRCFLCCWRKSSTPMQH